MKVVIAIDDSQCSLKAIDSVMKRKWADDTEFRLITVMEPVFAQYGFPTTYAIEPVIEAQRELSEHCHQLIDSKTAQLKNTFSKAHVTGKVLEGGIADAIIDEAKEWDADLIIVGSHGRKGFQRFLLGSVAEKVSNNAHCSVEIVKEKVRNSNNSIDTHNREILQAQH